MHCAYAQQLRSLVSGLFCLLLLPGMLLADAAHLVRLGNHLTPVADCLQGRAQDFRVTLQLEVPIAGKLQKIDVTSTRAANGAFEFTATHPEYALVIQRTDAQTLLALPLHQVAFVGSGPSAEQDHLQAAGMWQRLVSLDSAAGRFLGPALLADLPSLLQLATTLVSFDYDDDTGVWLVDGKVSIRFDAESTTLEVTSDEVRAKLQAKLGTAAAETAWVAIDDYKRIEVPREELERTVVRGVRRATEVLLPGKTLTSPAQATRKVERGELRWVDGQRVCLLTGTPEQIGEAHAALLRTESLKTIDSVLHSFGLVNTIRTGRWFRHDLDAAYHRLAPHIPEDHQRETAALAKGLGLDEHLVQTLNVFPELFHCSGFAVFGSATKAGTLYHGRVLDYMTTIGLQDSATNFIVAVDGKIPFANVGYAGFIGSVTGMNAQSVSLGEMGGRGEGNWDGVPMATLMRRALEECSTLQQVMDLWTNNPRTCEYYYVFADGKTNTAVGVAATPEKIEFVQPGQGHELLGEGIADAVVLSAGSRLEKLRERVTAKHGEIDAETAIWLMSRPVAMESNLHNALFVPAEGVLYVANADHKRPAAERPYVKLNLTQLLQELESLIPSESRKQTAR